MGFNEAEVLEILSLITPDPKIVLDEWYKRSDNEPLDLRKEPYSIPIYSFPIIVDGQEVAIATTVEMIYDGAQRDRIMSKYLTTDVYLASSCGYSNDNSYNCYLNVLNQFELPRDPDYPNMRVMKSTFFDVGGREIKYIISYTTDGKTPDGFFGNRLWHSDCGGYDHYRFDDLNIQIEYGYNIWDQWMMGSKINELIKVRNRDRKIDQIL